MFDVKANFMTKYQSLLHCKYEEESFWKVKKKLFPKLVQIPHSILDQSGNVLTDSQNVI